MSLRSRLLLGLLGLVSIGLIASDLLTYRALQSFLLARLDEQVAGAGDPVIGQLSSDERRGPPLKPSVVPGGTYGAVVTDDGHVLVSRPFGYGGDNLDNLPKPVLTIADLARRRPFTTKAADSDATDFRVLVRSLTSGDNLVVAVPMNEVQQTLGRLLAIELVATIAVLAGVGALALVVVRAGLRPLEDIGTTAGAIAAGDLSRRVARAEARTEVGRLGLSLNAMLTQIQTAFEARQESEDRLRRFVADASHELRTPLTSIRGYAELFRRGAADRPEDLALAMRRIEEESLRMGVLVDDLLLLARLDQGRPLERRSVDLSVVAADAVHDARAVEPDRVIELHACGPAPVMGDELRLRQVAANLLANARQHTPATAAVRVGVRATDDATVVLEVADDGPGLSPEEAAKAFERFYRADPSRNRNLGGTGLGLSIVAAVAEAHGGQAKVESTPGHGARFWVELPLATRRSHPSRRSRAVLSEQLPTVGSPGQPTRRSMDALVLLTADHNRVRGLFARFQAAEEAEDSPLMAELSEKIITDLEVHTTIEEEIFYPGVRDASEEIKDTVEEGVEEHHVAKILMSEIKPLSPEDDAFTAKMKVLIENIEHHAGEEEEELFPPCRKAMEKAALEDLGQRLEARKAQLGAPTAADKEHLSTEELKALASEQQIPGRSSMDRQELLATVAPA